MKDFQKIRNVASQAARDASAQGDVNRSHAWVEVVNAIVAVQSTKYLTDSWDIDRVGYGANLLSRAIAGMNAALEHSGVCLSDDDCISCLSFIFAYADKVLDVLIDADHGIVINQPSAARTLTEMMDRVRNLPGFYMPTDAEIFEEAPADKPSDGKFPATPRATSVASVFTEGSAS